MRADLGDPQDVPAQALNAELVATRTVVRPGRRLAFSIVNSGPMPVSFGAEYELQHRADNQWSRCNLEGAWKLSKSTLHPGAKVEVAVEIPADAAAGWYRVCKSVTGQGTGIERTLILEFEVAGDPT